MLKTISVITLALLGLVSASAETQPRESPDHFRWQSPDHFYSITVPADWEQISTTIKSHTTYRFKSPDGRAEIAISATYNLTLPDILPDDVLEIAFPKEKGVTNIKRIRGVRWDGLHREYANASDTNRWSAIAARNGSTVVLLTMSAPTSAFVQFRETFEKVGRSLKLGQ